MVATWKAPKLLKRLRMAINSNRQLAQTIRNALLTRPLTPNSIWLALPRSYWSTGLFPSVSVKGKKPYKTLADKLQCQRGVKFEDLQPQTIWKTDNLLCFYDIKQQSSMQFSVLHFLFVYSFINWQIKVTNITFDSPLCLLILGAAYQNGSPYIWDRTINSSNKLWLQPAVRVHSHLLQPPMLLL